MTYCKSNEWIGKLVVRLFAALFVASTLSACKATPSSITQERMGGRMAGTAVAKEAGVESKGKIERKVNLSIIGYNYGKQYINQYWVNGAGGDSLSVSSDSSGGGGIVCCVTLAPTVAPPAVRVRWQYDGCIYLEKSWSPEATKPVEEIYHFTKEVRVTIDPLIPPAPRYIETHFYPDGSVQVALTESISSPRLQLDGERGKNFKYPRCPNDKRPAD